MNLVTVTQEVTLNSLTKYLKKQMTLLMMVVAVIVRNTITEGRRRAREEEEPHPEDQPEQEGTDWMMTLWLMDLTVKIVLPRRKRPNGHQTQKNQKVILTMEG